MTISVIAKLTAKDGQRAQLAEAMQPMIQHVTDNEPDTLKYVLLEDTADENVLWMYEEYTSMEALGAHGSSEAMKTLGGATREFAAARPEVIVCNQLGGKGV